jgi:hypothetical protein
MYPRLTTPGIPVGTVIFADLRFRLANEFLGEDQEAEYQWPIASQRRRDPISSSISPALYPPLNAFLLP